MTCSHLRADCLYTRFSSGVMLGNEYGKPLPFYLCGIHCKQKWITTCFRISITWPTSKLSSSGFSALYSCNTLAFLADFLPIGQQTTTTQWWLAQHIPPPHRGINWQHTYLFCCVFLTYLLHCGVDVCVGHDHSWPGIISQGHRSNQMSSTHGHGNAVMRSVWPRSRTVFLVQFTKHTDQASHYLFILKFKDFSKTFKDPQISFSRTNSRRKLTAWAVEQQYLMFIYVMMVQ